MEVPRAPWGSQFPDVIVHGELRARDKHPAFAKAKTGDIDAAYLLVKALVSDHGLDQIEAIAAGREVTLMPVTALEAEGYNAIPDAFAVYLSDRLGLEIAAGEIVQSNRVAHTRSNGWHRLVTPATFEGEVRKGALYLLVDDHVGFGGTFANLRGFIETNGGSVVAMTTLTGTGGGEKIAIRPQTLDVLRVRHGEELEILWRSLFGHGLDCLTDVEGGYLGRVESVTQVSDRMAEAAARAREAGIPALDIG